MCVGVLVQLARSIRGPFSCLICNSSLTMSFVFLVDLAFPEAAETIVAAPKKWWGLHVTTGITSVHRTKRNAVWRLVPVATTTQVSDLYRPRYVPVK